MQEDLVCPICAKTSETKRQSTRHLRYCRTKVKDGPLTRRRSCAACIRAKTRCDMDLPTCSRCSGRRILCLYQWSNVGMQGVSGDELVRVPHCNQIQNVPTSEFPDVSLRNVISGPESSTETGLSEHDGLTSAFPYWLTQGTGEIDTPDIPQMLDFSSSSPPSLLGLYPPQALPPPQIHHFKDRVTRGTYYVLTSTSLFIPLSTQTILAKRDLRSGPTGSYLARAYCMSALRSYPGMLGGGRLPPFIHFRSRGREFLDYINSVEEELPESLAICSSIMKMYLSYVTRSSQNLKFIWRTIRTESRRIEDQWRRYDEWTTLAAIQAMTVYIILGLLGDDSEFVVDGEILMPILGTTKQMANKYQPTGWTCDGEIEQDQIPTWDDWALAESRRRTAIIIALIIHIFNISHGHDLPPCGDFADLSLPCSKALWQASTQESWEVEYRREYMYSSRNGEESPKRRSPTYQDLLLEDQGRGEVGAERLSDWFGGMDELGTLVTMAVSTL